MTTTTELFTDDWEVRLAGEEHATAVRLPHDAMIGLTRSADAATGNHGGYFPGVAAHYTRRWTVPADAAERSYSLVFEGVQGETRVLVDGHEAATCVDSYREFAVPLDGVVPGSVVEIEVVADNTRVPNSRWYTGTGIYRPVWLRSTGAVRIARDGVRIVTRERGSASVTVLTEGAPAGADVEVAFAFAGDETVIGSAAVGADGAAELRIELPEVRPWSAETPNLYDVTVTLRGGGATLDVARLRTGLRTLEVDAQHGLRVNGERVLLRGACVHHDNGVLGAATFAASEFRRARLLKEAGFNAIRSAHNPLSRAFLDACDELGLYVMDELTDVWVTHKTPHDEAEHFAEQWRASAAAMIAKDRNRPSVIMYSLGNEIADTANAAGVALAGEIHAFVTAADPTRPTTLAVNAMVNMLAARGSSPFEHENYTGAAPAKKGKREATSTEANAITAQLGTIMQLAARLPAADRASRDAFAAVDIAGYNYAHGRFRGDRRKYPERVIVDSESMSGDLPAIWDRVENVAGVIGSFQWTGWDYLGEAGIGSWSYGDESRSINKPFPALVAGCGTFDITGQPGAPALLVGAVWGTASAPGIAVRPLDRTGLKANKTPWRSTDALPSWSWGSLRGTAEIEVYSAADRVELVLNGRSLGRRRAGRRAGFVARFRAPYEPGELTAIAFTRGVETGRSSLRTAAEPTLRLRAESDTLAGPDDLAYLWIEFADAGGVVDLAADDRVTVTVEGAATLAGLGSAHPADLEPYTGATHATYRGRALAVLRGTDAAGPVVVTVRSEQHGEATIELAAVPAADALEARA